MTVTALITPFLGEHIDLEGLSLLIQRQMAAGVEGVLLLGTTGESATLSSEEQRAILQTARREAKGKIPLWVGTGRNSTRETIVQTRRAADLGADIALVVTPYYNKPSQEGLVRHFEAVAKSSLIPIVLYNVPSRTGVNLEPATVERLAALPHIIGIKEASGNVLQSSEMIRMAPSGFSVWGGDDPLTLPLMALGGRGIISVASNLVPEKMVQLVAAATSGKWHEARALHHLLMPLFKAIFIDVNPVPIKEALQLCGLPSGGCRLPLCEMNDLHRQTLAAVLRQMELLV